MKTFKELGTLPKVGDLIIRTIQTDKDDNVFMITDIVGNAYHISKKDHILHLRYIENYFSPLKQDTQ